MNSRSKPTGTRKTGTRSRKPATIDLEAKKTDEAKAGTDAKTTASSAAKTQSDTKTDASKSLGRDGAKQSSEKASTTTAEKKEDARQQAKPAPAPAPAAKSGGGFFSGLVGAAAAVVGLGAIGQYDGAKDIPFIGSLYSNENAQPEGDDNAAEIASLSEQIEALKNNAAAPVDLAPINDRLAQIEASAGSADLDEATTNRLGEIESGLADVTDTLASIAKAAENGENATSEQISTAITTVTKRLETLEGSVAELSNSGGAPSEETASKLAELETKLTDLAGAQIDLSPINGKISEIESSIAAVQEAVAANAKGVETLSSQSSDLQDTVASVKASEKVARSVAINALGAALENDDPISLAIASIESLGGKSEETERLAEIAKEGVPSKQSLLAGLAAFTNTVQNPVADTASGSISDRFWANAQNLVSFRSSGPQEGDSAIAILSRVKANLETSDLQGLLTEWEKLPAETRESGAGWIGKVNQRVEAFALFKTLSDNLTAQAG